MAYDYDRFEHEDHGGAFLMGLLAGTVLGAGLGMLFAPKTGNELRSQLSDSANRIQRQASERYQTASGRMNDMVSKGRDTYEQLRQKGREALHNVGTGTSAGQTDPGYTEQFGSGTMSGAGNLNTGPGGFSTTTGSGVSSS
jgi:gas vesicle protein